MPVALRDYDIDPIVSSHFRLELDGFDNALAVQEVDMPDRNHIRGNIGTETGQIPVVLGVEWGDLTVRYLKRADTADLPIEAWCKQAVNPLTGAVALLSDLRRDGSLIVVNGAKTEIEDQTLTFCVPGGITGNKWTKTSKGLIMVEVKIWVANMETRQLA